MDLQTKAYIEHFSICRQYDKTSVTHTAPLTPVPLPDSAWEKLSVDISVCSTVLLFAKK